MPLRLRRGTNAERLTFTPAQGELIYVTDTKRLWVGDGLTVGGIDIVASGGGSLQGSINLNNYNIEGLGNINITGSISNGSIVLDSNVISSTTSFIAPGSGNLLGQLALGNETNPLQTIREWKEPVEPIEIQQGITNGFFSLVTTKNVQRGTLSSPTAVFSGDCLTLDRVYGYDGFSSVLSSSIWRGVDPTETPGPGYIPGAIALITNGSMGENVAGFDSHGYFSINKFPAPAEEALDVVGNALFTGSVSAAAFKGSFFADDSTTIIDGSTGNISNGTLSLNAGTIFSNDTFITGISGETVSKITFGSTTSSSQSVRYFHDSYEPFEKTYGISDGINSLQTAKYASRGTLNSPTTLLPGDCVSVNIGYGYDGSDYQISTLIWQGVDPAGTITPGNVPGTIVFFTNGPGGLNASSSFNSDGYLGIRNGFNPITEALDVTGNIKLAGTIKLNQNTAGGTAEEYYGISNGASSLLSLKYASEGTLSSPTALTSGEAISGQINYGHDGTSYVLSSVIGFGVDPNASVSTGAVPGNIVFITTDSSGALNTSSGFDSQGYLGILNGTNAASEALDVYGNGKINGKVKIYQDIDGESAIDCYGVSTFGFTGLATNKYMSRGTISSPTSVNTADCISYNAQFGHDGTNYQLSSIIWCGVDPNASVSPGAVPGSILFFTSNSSGIPNASAGFSSNGYLGILNGSNDPTEALDVYGNAVIRGDINAAAFRGTFVADDSTIIVDGINGNINGNQITASAFKGTFVADDSTVIVDGLNGNVTGNTVTSNGFVMFGSYDATARSGLTAANGMVIYNTTANRFQGFQNGAWINLDDGTAAP